MAAERLSEDEHWMRRALALAEQAAALEEVPVGAVVVMDGKEIGAGFNRPISSCDPTAHAEICALRQAATYLANYRLSGATLYVTLEPCTMCVGAIIHSRISRVVYGTTEPKAGAVESSRRTFEEPQLNWRVETSGGLLAGPCSRIISDFFSRRREHLRQQRNAISASE